MALYKYFKSKSESKSPFKYDVLPDPHDPSMSSSILPAAIKAANESVKIVLDKPQDKTSTSRGQYEVFSPNEKAVIAKCAVEIGVTKAIGKLQRNYPGRQLKESTIRTWVKKYNASFRQTHMTITEIESKKRGKPLLLGEELDSQVKAYLIKLRDKGGVINSAIVKAAAIGIVLNHDMRLLKENGGHIEVTKHWAQLIVWAT